jgi:hypothetical protein
MAIPGVARITGISLAMIEKHYGHFAIRPCAVSARRLSDPALLSTDVQSSPPLRRLDQVSPPIFFVGAVFMWFSCGHENRDPCRLRYRCKYLFLAEREGFEPSKGF